MVVWNQSENKLTIPNIFTISIFVPSFPRFFVCDKYIKRLLYAIISSQMQFESR